MQFYSVSWLIVASLSTFFIVFLGIPKIVSIAKLKRLFDDYRDERKIHSGFIPNIGGIVLVIGFVIGLSLKPSSIAIPGYNFLIASLLVLFIAGVKDDLLVISPAKKLIAQFIAATLIIFGADLKIVSFGGVFGLGELPLLLSITVTYAVFIVMINAINLLDGIDGLAASVTCLSVLLFSGLFYVTGQFGLFTCCIILAVSYGTFLIHNWAPAQIFMGDTGSLVAGFLLAFTGIHFLNTGLALGPVAFWQPFIPVILVSILVLPLYDTLRVILVRLLNGKSPLYPDNNHVHHQVISVGLNHAQATFLLIIMNIIIVGFTFAGSYILNSPNTLLLLTIILSIILFPTVSIKRKLIQTINPNLIFATTADLSDEQTGISTAIDVTEEKLNGEMVEPAKTTEKADVK